MKAFIVTALSAGSLCAAPVGDPAFPELLGEGYFIPSTSALDLRGGYEGDFVSDARMKQTQEGHGRVDTFEQNTNSGLATLNILDRMDLFGVFGSSRVSSDWRFIDADQMVNRIQMETGYRFLWAVGTRCILLKWGKATVGVGGRYSASSSKPTWTVLNGVPIPTNGTHLKWREWQADLDFSYQLEIFTPYIGAKYSNAHAKMGGYPIGIANNGSGSLHMRNRTLVGLVVGCTLTTGKFFMLNVEGRLIDEVAASIVGDFRF